MEASDPTEADNKEQVDVKPTEEVEEHSDGEDKSEDREWNGVDEMESVCMSCGENGLTRFLIQKVPYFRELVISSFYCDHCGESNNDVAFGGEIQMKGCVYEFHCQDSRELNRQVIKSDSCSISIPEIEFEIPASTQKGEISTIEGILRQAHTNLMLYQAERMEQMPEVGEKVAVVIDALRGMADGDKSRYPFTLIISDTAGNSFLENPFAPAPDPNIKLSYFTRTKEQDEALGLRHETAQYRDASETNYEALLTIPTHPVEDAVAKQVAGGAGSSTSTIGVNRNPLDALEKEVLSFPAPCPSCGVMGASLTAMTDIPHFKEVLIMAFSCEECGYRNSEMKAGGAVPKLGTTVTLQASSPRDLTRDVLKSDSAMVTIPELDLELQHGTLGGVYTTVEGLLTKIKDNLIENNPFYVGDSSKLHHYSGGTTIAGPEGSDNTLQPHDIRDTKARYSIFLDRLTKMADGLEFPFTLIIRDPLGNSFISSQMGTFLPPELDTALSTEDFERSFDENEDFGLNDMDTGDDACDLPDRLTHVYPKLPDHPFRFAQGGAGDGTQGGYAPAPDAKESTNKMPGVSVDSALDTDDQEPPLVVGKRQFSDDSDIEFLPYENFSGAREGFVYRLGSKGLGYYRDVRKGYEIEWRPE